MTLPGIRLATRLTATVSCAALALSLCACTSEGGRTQDDDADDATPVAGSVAVFTPSDAMTLSGDVPLNTWGSFVSALSDALQERDVARKRIVASSSGDLDEQSRAVQDYVVERVSDGTVSDEELRATTLVVAPAYDTDEATARYGDYARTPVADGDGDADAGNGSDDDAATNGTAGNGTQAGTDDGTSDGTNGDSDDDTDAAAVSRLASSLNLAREHGMHVVMLSDTVDGATPDAIVAMADAEGIGRIQARKLADKLDLDKTSADNPKAIEVLLPVTGWQETDDTDAAGTDSASSDSSGDTRSDDAAASDEASRSDAWTDTAQSDGTAGESGEDADARMGAAFAASLFKGVWSVLQPYFEDGKAFSPSGLLDAHSTDDDWSRVAFADDAGDAIASRLASDEEDVHTRIDGVIAMNDHAAQQVVASLQQLGYTGSAADINPSITISGIVENITGRKDLQRNAVPDPIKAPQADATDADDEAEAKRDLDEFNRRWPIVTGYGAYVDAMPGIVGGSQWMTALEDRAGLADDTAAVCAALNDGGTPASAGVASLGSTTVDGHKVPTVSRDLLAVSASNLKETLIDPGYISLADAGL
ncbi:hypothetical protein [Bifidobacterium samirii]|uniref:Uncharacterized protein n=1 Tax=Bifidobacterium samirii TaxID=2306974 RepID=A0A430FNP6_9BIFI|nr:hypothetical protein [Bifidobacterium samirii]RSX54460.1 hypothetical protein D2E24_1581 [Bifidobacterium samirii]